MTVPAAEMVAGAGQNAAETPVSTSPEAFSLASILDRPNKRLKPEVFWLVAAEYQPRDQICFYVYRLWPVIDRALVHGPNCLKYIDKLSDTVPSEDWLLKHWGSGDYEIALTDAGKPRGSTQVARTVCKLRVDEYPPVLDKAELVLGDPANRGYVEGLRARGLLDKEGELEDKAAVTQMVGLVGDLVKNRPAGAAEAGTRAAVELVKDAAQVAIRMTNPLEVMDKILPLVQRQDGGGVELLRLLADQNAKHTELIVRLIEGTRGSPSASLADKIEEFLKLEKLLGRTESKGSWVADLAVAIPLISPLLMQLARMFRPEMPAPPGPDNPPPPAVAPAPVIPFPASSASPSGTVQPTVELDTQTVLSELLSALQRGFPGSDFAAFVCFKYGDELYNSVRQLGKPALLAALQGEQAVWAQLTPYQDQLEGWLDDFLAYGEEDEAKAA